MNTLKQASHYFIFNDSLTGMKTFKGRSFMRWSLTRGGAKKSTQRRPSHEFPIYWLLLLCLLLLINSVMAEPNSLAPTKLNGTFSGGEQSISLVIVDRSVEQVERLLTEFRGELHLLILEEDIEPFEQINLALYDEPLYSNVTIIAKASSSAIYLGGRWIDKNYLLEHQSTFNLFGEQFSRNSELTLYTTNLITSHSGQEFLGVLANLTRLNIDIIHIKGAGEGPLWVNRPQFSF